jgi:hypothetical protein
VVELERDVALGIVRKCGDIAIGNVHRRGDIATHLEHVRALRSWHVAKSDISCRLRFPFQAHATVSLGRWEC